MYNAWEQPQSEKNNFMGVVLSQPVNQPNQVRIRQKLIDDDSAEAVFVVEKILLYAEYIFG